VGSGAGSVKPAPNPTRQENANSVAALFPHKVPISARKWIFIGGINLPINHMPVNFLAENSANNFVHNCKAETHTLWRKIPPETSDTDSNTLWQNIPPVNVCIV
jgi:hypothetical protein